MYDKVIQNHKNDTIAEKYKYIYISSWEYISIITKNLTTYSYEHKELQRLHHHWWLERDSHGVGSWTLEVLYLFSICNWKSWSRELINLFMIRPEVESINLQCEIVNQCSVFIRQEVDGIVDEVDEDKSGTVDFDEFLAMMTGWCVATSCHFPSKIKQQIRSSFCMSIFWKLLTW